MMICLITEFAARDLIQEHNRLTWENWHGKALQVLAEKLGMDSEAKELQTINQRHKIAGHLTPELQAERKEVYDRVHTRARKILGNRYKELN